MLMRYLDLAPYMIGAKTDPKVLNIGWLDGANDYIKGQLDLNLVLKLLTLTLFNLDQRPINKPSGRHEHPQNIIVHTMHMIGSPVSCPYCQKPIQLIDDQSRVMYLGKNEMRLPNADRSHGCIRSHARAAPHPRALRRHRAGAAVHARTSACRTGRPFRSGLSQRMGHPRSQ